MSVFRLSPLSVPSQRGHGPGSCSACEKAIERSHEFVFIYGETFHRDCAFYRHRDQAAGDTARGAAAS